MTNELTPEQIWIDHHGERLYDDHPRKLEGIEYVRADLLATKVKEEREAALRDVILLVDTAPLCHSAGKQYIDPVALVQRMNAALEAATEK